MQIRCQYINKKIKEHRCVFGDIQEIWGAILWLQTGEVVALIDTNGAGKSRNLKTISGRLRPKKRELLFEKQPIHKVEPFHLIEMGIANVPEARRIFVEMTVEENLDMGSVKGEARIDGEKNQGADFC